MDEFREKLKEYLKLEVSLQERLKNEAKAKLIDDVTNEYINVATAKIIDEYKTYEHYAIFAERILQVIKEYEKNEEAKNNE